ncbi:hypothetical protein SAMN04489760_103108 [Syntrophus gentianae]|uniref:T4 bacteriophage base plate protein n=1 Tax=Syntrophus gentianae TaxID=43775 RepID=A0A1H7V926_9BACT|nr:hypothetical protein [Syntrophus gentianae]SEM05751.1 hypothetical protein SAMN04489760_103108 [Syntrophus gentianae]
MMRLPGGILRDGARRRDFAFRPLTGEVELALAEAAEEGSSLPTRVTKALAAALEHIGGDTPLPATVAALSVGDRQFLMARLAVGFGLGEDWFTARCGKCGEQFDFAVDYRNLPVKEAGEGYPFAGVETSLGRCNFRVPTGADQEILAGLDDDSEPIRCLVKCCLVALSGRRVEDNPSHGDMVEAFAPGDIARIEAALEEAAPEMAVSVQAPCPVCGTPHEIDVDPYRILYNRLGGGLLREVHILASTYHWSEAEILALPLHRRRRYLDLIDEARGITR